MLWLVNPNNLDKIDKETENAILALLTQLVREDIDSKKLIGKDFIKGAGLRIEMIKAFTKNRDEKNYYLETNQIARLKELMEAKQISESVLFDDQTQAKCFKLISILVKNCQENIKVLKSILKPMEAYLKEDILVELNKAQEEKNKDGIAHLTEIKDKLKNLIQLVSDV